ncbi:Outer membrane protein assembly factor BamB, contains PQQ-like beta-propeller repeat [Halomicrobium zhouii]|uniref:Outer membrane protein assembly factor BamB, contains PQQ-like beta-propeller repeat n=1 Tax=Halomicrobium zhouii TaxID=767519 RepID=A0A1I6K9H4_9EURY|nr:PQQ-like beta-propeller repeat protein [Halomicrobium zhouii]SFR87794.1 Outer membrane protein assembly factor BamB, contains PQQ-like beta-propeller repeat [Halomicrobium zhouii]
MPDPWPRRRALRAVAAAAPLALAGCSDRDAPGTPTDGPDTDETTTAPTDEEDRPTATERSPKPLDAAGTWPQFGAEAGHTGVTAATGLPEDGEPYWHLRRIRSGPPVLADGRLFHYAELGEDTSDRPTLTPTPEEDTLVHRVDGPPALVARDASDGRIEWTQSLPNASRGWPALADGRVITCVKGQVAAFDVADGSPAWRVDVGDDSPTDPTVVDDAVVVPFSGSVDGQSGEYVRRPSVRAYALDDGEERWSVEPPKRQNGVAVADGTVAVASGGWDGTGVVLGLSLADGSERWRTEVAGDAFTTPVAVDGTAYVASSDDYVQALELADGSERWRRDFEGRPRGLAVDGETVYVGAGRSLAALAASDGSVDWQVVPASESESVQSVAVGTDAVYAGTIGLDAPLVVLDPTDGSERWRHDFPDKVVGGDQVMGGVESQPVVADGALFVNAVDGLYAFGPAE